MKDSLTSIFLIRQKKDKLTCLVNSSLHTHHWNLTWTKNKTHQNGLVCLYTITSCSVEINPLAFQLYTSFLPAADARLSLTLPCCCKSPPYCTPSFQTIICQPQRLFGPSLVSSYIGMLLMRWAELFFLQWLTMLGVLHYKMYVLQYYMTLSGKRAM